jgi:hypothetical protein
MTSVSTSTVATASPLSAVASRERSFWPAVIALGVGGFAIGTGEFVIMGLLPEVAKDLGVSIPQAGPCDQRLCAGRRARRAAARGAGRPLAAARC